MKKDPRQKDGAHLDFIRSLSCIICGNNIETEVAHIRSNDIRVAKFNPGSHRPHDRWTNPLCGKHHDEQHEMNEKAFWAQYGIDPIFTAMALYSVSGDYERGEKIIQNARQREFA